MVENWQFGNTRREREESGGTLETCFTRIWVLVWSCQRESLGIQRRRPRNRRKIPTPIPHLLLKRAHALDNVLAASAMRTVRREARFSQCIHKFARCGLLCAGNGLFDDSWIFDVQSHIEGLISPYRSLDTQPKPTFRAQKFGTPGEWRWRGEEEAYEGPDGQSSQQPFVRRRGAA